MITILSLVGAILIILSMYLFIDNDYQSKAINMLMRELEQSLVINKLFAKSFILTESMIKDAEPEAWAIIENDDIYKFQSDKDFNYNIALLANLTNYLLKKEYKRKNNVTESNKR